MDNCILVKNGLTNDLVEGEMKTPIGEFDLGIAFGLHERSEIDINEDIPYFKIQNNQYWIDDINSKFYNQLIMTDKKPIISGEHLIDYADGAYEYAIEIKVNPHNMYKKGSAIMLHCTKSDYTYGCVGISRENMIKLLSMIDSNTKSSSAKI